MDRLPLKMNFDATFGGKVTKKKYELTSKVKSVLDRKFDKWTPEKAYERIRVDLKLLTSFARIILSFLMGT